MSYVEHFKLEEQPFRLTPDPEFVYWSKQHSRAKAYMESTIWLADGFVVITGEIGSGKTTLLKSFLGELENDVIYAVVSQTQLKPKQFLQAVLTEFGFKPFKKSKVELLDMLNMFLLEQYGAGKKIVLIVDEAQNLRMNVLEEVRMLSGIETDKEKVLRIILAGQPELKDTLKAPELKQLMQRVRLQFHIKPLDKRETREYIEHRVTVAGGKPSDIFNDNTYEPIFRYTGGVPRLINTLCDTALLCAYGEGKLSITGDDILAAANELEWKEDEHSTGKFRQVPHLVPPTPRPKHLVKIVVRSEGKILSEHLFGEGKIIIGRSPDNDIYIRSKFVSRHHAQLISNGTGCMVQDTNSTNGVYIGDERISSRRLQDGEIVKVGAHELIYTDLREQKSQKKTKAPRNKRA